MIVSFSDNSLYRLITEWLVKVTKLSLVQVSLLWAALYVLVNIFAMVAVASRFELSTWFVVPLFVVSFFSFSRKDLKGVETTWALIPPPVRRYVEVALCFFAGIHYLEQESLFLVGYLFLAWTLLSVVDLLFFGKGKSRPAT